MTQIGFQTTSSDRAKTKPGRNRLIKLQRIISERLDEYNLRMLCIQLGIDFYYLPGEEKSEKTKALIALLVRHGRIPELIRILLLLHPDIPWKKLLNISRYPSWMRNIPRRLIKSLPVISLMFIFSALLVFIPLSSANWQDVLGVSGEIFTGTWDDLNCTHSFGYWREHPDEWPVNDLILVEVDYTKEEILSILYTPPRGDATYILAFQLIAAKLNILNGADQTILGDAILDAESWLVTHPLGSKPKNLERKIGIASAEVLEMFNKGEIGPGMCLEDLRRNISSMAMFDTFYRLAPSGSEQPDFDFPATPVGLLPEIPGTPPDNHEPEEEDTPPPTSGSEAPSTPFPTQHIEPTQGNLITPTLAPTQNPLEELTTTPEEGALPEPTSTPTAVPPPTSTNVPTEPPPPTPTNAPTAYPGPPGCTQPLEFWAMELGNWKLKEFVIANNVYNQKDALGILLANPQDDATYILAQQYITAQLNIASPADPTAIIEVMYMVEDWFFNHPLGSAPKNPGRKEGLGYAEYLEEYNLGFRGPGPCQLPTSTPIPTSTSTPTPELSLPTSAPTMVLTLVPTPTPTPTLELPTEPAP